MLPKSIPTLVKAWFQTTGGELGKEPFSIENLCIIHLITQYIYLIYTFILKCQSYDTSNNFNISKNILFNILFYSYLFIFFSEFSKKCLKLVLIKNLFWKDVIFIIFMKNKLFFKNNLEPSFKNYFGKWSWMDPYKVVMWCFILLMMTQNPRIGLEAWGFPLD